MRYFLLLLLLGCADPMGPFTPANATAIAAPLNAPALWQHVLDCSHLPGTLAAVTWFTVPGGGFSCPGGSCDGFWSPPHAIYLAHQRMADTLLIEHEMLHDLLQQGDHPPVFQTCGLLGYS